MKMEAKTKEAEANMTAAQKLLNATRRRRPDPDGSILMWKLSNKF